MLSVSATFHHSPVTCSSNLFENPGCVDQPFAEQSIKKLPFMLRFSVLVLLRTLYKKKYLKMFVIHNCFYSGKHVKRPQYSEINIFISYLLLSVFHCH